ncbi:hypothetical protein PG996_008699 [Apiospora saccharicola]|uniref:Secreted protein n=1 Tax=Apiospora saccharicola TaxID=335842 RepID=A0ABR1UYN8_9PEZI
MSSPLTGLWVVAVVVVREICGGGGVAVAAAVVVVVVTVGVSGVGISSDWAEAEAMSSVAATEVELEKVPALELPPLCGCGSGCGDELFRDVRLIIHMVDGGWVEDFRDSGVVWVMGVCASAVLVVPIGTTLGKPDDGVTVVGMGDIDWLAAGKSTDGRTDAAPPSSAMVIIRGLALIAATTRFAQGSRERLFHHHCPCSLLSTELSPSKKDRNGRWWICRRGIWRREFSLKANCDLDVCTISSLPLENEKHDVNEARFVAGDKIAMPISSSLGDLVPVRPVRVVRGKPDRDTPAGVPTPPVGRDEEAAAEGMETLTADPPLTIHRPCLSRVIQGA